MVRWLCVRHRQASSLRPKALACIRNARQISGRQIRLLFHYTQRKQHY